MRPEKRLRTLFRPFQPSLPPMLLSLALAVAALPGAAHPTAQELPAPSAQANPKLVVILAIDQLIPEQMERLEGSFTGGLARIRREGARFDQAALPYASTETGPGHASLATGCLPATHGIVGNVMRVRESGVGIYCVGDGKAKAVTSTGVQEGGSVSAANFGVRTLGDWMKDANPASRVCSVSGKDRSAVSLAGFEGDLALWWSSAGEGFQSSTAYTQELPAYVKSFNAGWVKRWEGYVWNARFEPDNAPPGTAVDDRAGESSFPGGDRSFPHEFVGPFEGKPSEAQIRTLSSQVSGSLAGDRNTIEMARMMLVREGLGLDEVPDLLGIALSGPGQSGPSLRAV